MAGDGHEPQKARLNAQNSDERFVKANDLLVYLVVAECRKVRVGPCMMCDLMAILVYLLYSRNHVIVIDTSVVVTIHI